MRVHVTQLHEMKKTLLIITLKALQEEAGNIRHCKSSPKKVLQKSNHIKLKGKIINYHKIVYRNKIGFGKRKATKNIFKFV